MHTLLRQFLQGLLGPFDVAGRLYDQEVGNLVSRSDTEAIASDWQAVSDDIRAVLPQPNQVAQISLDRGKSAG